MQAGLVLRLGPLRKDEGFRVVTELRVHVKEDRFRVPDLCLLSAGAPKEQGVRHPPILCMETLSPRVTAMRQRVRDYVEMGVPQVWLLDPRTRCAMVCIENTVTEHSDGTLTVPGTSLQPSIAEIFEALD